MMGELVARRAFFLRSAVWVRTKGPRRFPDTSSLRRVVLFDLSKRPLKLSQDGDWDLGYEVCFYRDLSWPCQKTAHQDGYAAKRTFDLCLFGEKAIIIIEAKVFQRFEADKIKES